MSSCKLCGGVGELIHDIKKDKRVYYNCKQCDCIYTDPDFYIAIEDEKNIYDYHQNSIEDQGYVDFLNRAIIPSLAYITPNMKALDYGCGPGPTLSTLLAQKGIQCDDFDPIYVPSKLKDNYDIIYSTECFEHFFYPKEQIEKLTNLLNCGGYLVIMTSFHQGVEHFKTWYYKLDPTHVYFYNATTFAYIAQKYGYTLCYTDNSRVIILRKN